MMRRISQLTGMAARVHRPPPGTAPGTLSIDPAAPPPRVTLIGYGKDEFHEQVVEDLSSLHEARGRWPILWVNVDGVRHAGTLQALGDLFGLHRLALEDVVNVPQRAKAEWYEGHLFVVVRMARLTPELDTEQISLFLGPGYVLTVQEREGDPLEPVRARLRAAHGRIRGAGADYLAYAVLDAIVDHYFPVLEAYGDRLERLEGGILAGGGRSAMAELYALKREILSLRRAVWPARDALNTLVRDPNEMIESETRVYLRDCHDHVIQVLELVEMYRDLSASLTDLYLSSVSYRMNEIMKVLTMFAAIFIPLSFIAGLYGMNFDHAVSPFNMPELEWYWGYPFALALMATVASGLLFFFWRRGWIGGGDSPFIDGPEQ